MNLLVPIKRSLWVETFLAFLQRAIVLAIIVSVTAIRWQDITHLRDGEGYLNLANACLTGHFASVPHGDAQYFIGYPFILSLFMRFLPAIPAVYTLHFLTIAGIFWLSTALFPHPWITRWFIFAMPTYVLFASFNMSETLLIFLFFASVSALVHKRYSLLAMALSLAMVVRPQFTAFLYTVILLDLLRQKQFRVMILVGLLPCLAVLGMLFFNQWAFGEFLYNFKLYGAHETSKSLINLPLQGLLLSTGDTTIRLSNKIYVWGSTLLTLLGVFLLWIKTGKKKIVHPGVMIFLKTSVIQLLFLLSLNSRWAFLELPRYLIPILPAALWGFDFPLMKNKWVLLMGSLLAMAFAIYAEGTGNRYAH